MINVDLAKIENRIERSEEKADEYKEHTLASALNLMILKTSSKIVLKYILHHNGVTLYRKKLMQKCLPSELICQLCRTH